MPVVSTRWLANHWRRRQFHRLTVVTERHVFVVEPHAPFSQRWPVINTLRNGQSRLTSVLAIAPNFLVVRRHAGSERLTVLRHITFRRIIVLWPERSLRFPARAKSNASLRRTTVLWPFGQAPTRGVTIFLLRNKFLQVVDASLRRTTVNAGPWPAVRQLGKVIVLDRIDALRIRARFFDPS